MRPCARLIPFLSIRPGRHPPGGSISRLRSWRRWVRSARRMPGEVQAQRVILEPVGVGESGEKEGDEHVRAICEGATERIQVTDL